MYNICNQFSYSIAMNDDNIIRKQLSITILQINKHEMISLYNYYYVKSSLYNIQSVKLMHT